MLRCLGLLNAGLLLVAASCCRHALQHGSLGAGADTRPGAPGSHSSAVSSAQPLVRASVSEHNAETAASAAQPSSSRGSHPSAAGRLLARQQTRRYRLLQQRIAAHAASGFALGHLRALAAACHPGVQLQVALAHPSDLSLWTALVLFWLLLPVTLSAALTSAAGGPSPASPGDALMPMVTRHWSWLHLVVCAAPWAVASSQAAASKWLFDAAGAPPSPLGPAGVGTATCGSSEVCLPGLLLAAQHGPWALGLGLLLITLAVRQVRLQGQL